jgi:hypothetical protein
VHAIKPFGAVPPLIFFVLKLGTRRRKVVSIGHLPNYLQRPAPPKPLDRKQGEV